LFEVAVSEHPKQTIELAAHAAAAGFSPIIAAGGDGTVGDVLNGIAKTRGERDFGILGVLPLGTGNDLAHNLGIPLHLPDAARLIAAGKWRKLDVGKVNQTYFLNNSAAGLEPYVTQKQVKIQWLKGIPRYLLAAVQAILDHPTWNSTLEWQDGHYEGPLTLVSVGNGARTGGLFYMTPDASPDDGQLTFTFGYRPTRLATFAALPKTLSPEGGFVTSPGVQQIHSPWLNIRLSRPSPAHADGELFPEPLAELQYRLLPACLRLLAP
jgi:diacylglycerol kinase (ATP)